MRSGSAFLYQVMRSTDRHRTNHNAMFPIVHTCVCAGNKDSSFFRKHTFRVLLVVAHAVLLLVVNGARLRGSISWLFQLAFTALQVEFSIQYYYLHSHLVFGNCLIFSQRLSKLLELGERDDLLRKADDVV